MKTIDEIRRENLATLIEEAGSAFALSERYGCTEAAIKTMARAYKDSKSGTPKGIGNAAARKLEGVMHKERGWLDHSHGTQVLMAAERQATYATNVVTIPQDGWITELLEAAKASSDDGRRELIGMAKIIATQKPRAKANRAR